MTCLRARGRDCASFVALTKAAVAAPVASAKAAAHLLRPHSQRGSKSAALQAPAVASGLDAAQGFRLSLLPPLLPPAASGIHPRSPSCDPYLQDSWSALVQPCTMYHVGNCCNKWCGALTEWSGYWAIGSVLEFNFQATGLTSVKRFNSVHPSVSASRRLSLSASPSPSLPSLCSVNP